MASNISGESDNSNTLNISTEDTPPPPEPMGLSAVGNDGSVDNLSARLHGFP